MIVAHAYAAAVAKATMLMWAVRAHENAVVRPARATQEPRPRRQCKRRRQATSTCLSSAPVATRARVLAARRALKPPRMQKAVRIASPPTPVTIRADQLGVNEPDVELLSKYRSLVGGRRVLYSLYSWPSQFPTCAARYAQADPRAIRGRRSRPLYLNRSRRLGLRFQDEGTPVPGTTGESYLACTSGAQGQ